LPFLDTAVSLYMRLLALNKKPPDAALRPRPALIIGAIAGYRLSTPAVKNMTRSIQITRIGLNGKRLIHTLIIKILKKVHCKTRKVHCKWQKVSCK